MRQFSLDMIPGGAQTAVACNQYESGDTWVFALYYDGGRYSIPEDAEVSITGTKPDGAAYKVAGTVTDNAVVIEVTEQMTACAGRSIAEILVESETDGTTLYSANFPLLVEPAAVQGDLSPSEIPSAIVDTDGNVYLNKEGIAEEQINEIIDDYVTEHNITGVTAEEVQEMVDGYLDESADTVISDWLDDHPEATTTVQDGTITLAKLAPEVTQELGGGKLNYKWYAAGYMRANVRTFQGWTHNVVWEPDLGKAIGIVISGTSAHTYEEPWYRVTIDPSGYMSVYEEVVLYDTDGTTPYTSTAYYMGSLCRLSDGRYMAIDSGHDIYISSDYCKTFVRQQTYAFEGTGSMFGLRQLSNGRLIVGFGGNKNGFYYSDNVGQTWTFTSADNSGLGQQAYPSGGFKPFEPCFIDCGSGKVACFARKSTAAYISGGTLSECVYKHLEPAVYSVSTDYGATWSAWVDSTTITDMTASNAKVCIIGDTVHMVFASRYTHTDGSLRIFYTYASIEDAYADNWATPVQIDEGHWDESTASDSHDGGYPSVWTDGVGNLFAVYYDGDGSGTAAGANWRLLEGSPAIKAPAIVNEGSGSLNVGYAQKIIDEKLAKLRGYINDLYTKIGELPDDPDEYDGTSLITSGLAAWFRPGTQSDWNDYTLTSVSNSFTAVGANLNSTTAGSVNVAPTAFNNGFANVSSIYGKSTLAEMGASTVFTVEILSYSTSDDGVFYLRNAVAAGGTNTLYRRNRKFGTSRKGTYHFVGVFTSGSIDWYINGQFYATETTSIAFADMLAAYPLFATNSGYGYVNDCRIYTRALTADEIRNNYLYMHSNVDFDTAPTFS